MSGPPNYYHLVEVKYLGSKNRIAQYILPIMLDVADKNGLSEWIEPFVGGGNMIDKVPSRFNRLGLDISSHTIAALVAVRDMVDHLPNEVSHEYYQSLKGAAPDPITSLIRFGASFGGKFENGYARRDGKSMWGECLRNATKQSPGLQGVKLINSDYQSVSNVVDSLIYCDPPYEGTTTYTTGAFNHAEFWDWCRHMSRNNKIFISEYRAPDDFKCVWSGYVQTNFASQRTKGQAATEKLFTI